MAKRPLSSPTRRPEDQLEELDRAFDRATRPGALGQRAVNLIVQQLLFGLAIAVPIAGGVALGLRHFAREKAERTESATAALPVAGPDETSAQSATPTPKVPNSDRRALQLATTRTDIEALLRQGDVQRRLRHWKEALALYNSAARLGSGTGLAVAEFAQLAALQVEAEVRSLRAYLDNLVRLRKSRLPEMQGTIDKQIDDIRAQLDRA